MENTIQAGEQPPKKRTNGKRNRTAGSRWEWECRDVFHALGFPHVVTCNGESKSRDYKIIDLINKDESVNGRLPYNVQCKNSSSLINYDRIFNGYKKKVKDKKKGGVKFLSVPAMEKVEGIINVILHKFTSNKGENNDSGRFMPRGNFAITTMSDFIMLIRERIESKKRIVELEQRILELESERNNKTA